VETVDVSLVDQAQAGDLVLVHAGVAITRVEGTRS
jgi:hydrogenase maturation factor